MKVVNSYVDYTSDYWYNWRCVWVVTSDDNMMSDWGDSDTGKSSNAGDSHGVEVYMDDGNDDGRCKGSNGDSSDISDGGRSGVNYGTRSGSIGDKLNYDFIFIGYWWL